MGLGGDGGGGLEAGEVVGLLKYCHFLFGLFCPALSTRSFAHKTCAWGRDEGRGGWVEEEIGDLCQLEHSHYRQFHPPCLPQSVVVITEHPCGCRGRYSIFLFFYSRFLVKSLF